MQKFYRNQKKQKPRPKTPAQLRREWERTVIAGGVVRASVFAPTASILNRGRGAMVRVIGVPLIDDRQYALLDQVADEGILGQTAEEVAAWFIRDGLLARMKKACKCCGAQK